MDGNDDVVSRHEFRFIGMSRSGNHAILNWVLQQTTGRVCFLNCAEPCSNPFATARPAAPDGLPFVSSYPIDLPAEAAGRHSKKDYLIYSYEDCYLGMVADERFEARHDEWVGRSALRRDVLVLRDPFNLFASRYKSGFYRERLRSDGPNLVTRGSALRIWKQHAREFLEPGRRLKRQPLAISFNRWAIDASYRRQLAAELGLSFTDAGATAVPKTGGGSSFDGRMFDGRAERMRVQGRWMHFENDPAFWRGFDDQTVRLSESLFGPAPEPLRRLKQSVPSRA